MLDNVARDSCYLHVIVFPRIFMNKILIAQTLYTTLKIILFIQLHSSLNNLKMKDWLINKTSANIHFLLLSNTSKANQLHLHYTLHY
jgi:hypothetical protein